MRRTRLGVVVALIVPAIAAPAQPAEAAPSCFATASDPARDPLNPSRVVAYHGVVCTEEVDSIIVVGQLTKDGSQRDSSSEVCYAEDRCSTSTAATYDGRGTWHGFTTGSYFVDGERRARELRRVRSRCKTF